VCGGVWLGCLLVGWWRGEEVERGVLSSFSCLWVRAGGRRGGGGEGRWRGRGEGGCGGGGGGGGVGGVGVGGACGGCLASLCWLVLWFFCVFGWVGVVVGWGVVCGVGVGAGLCYVCGEVVGLSRGGV